MRKEAFIAFLFYLLNSLVIGIPVIFHDRTFVPADLIDRDFLYPPREKITYSYVRLDRIFYSYPTDVLFNKEIKRGHIPLWNPYIFSGYPLLGNGQNNFLYPLKVLFHLLFSPYKAGDLLTVLHIFLIQFFTFLYLNELGLSFFPSLSGGFILGYNAFSIWYNHLRSGLVQMAWLPFLLFSYEKFLKNRNFLWLGAGGLSAAFILSGYIPYGFYSILIFSFVTILKAYQHIKKGKNFRGMDNPVIPFIFILIIGFLIDSIYIFAVIEHASLSRNQRLLLPDINSPVSGGRGLLLAVLFSPLLMGSDNTDFYISSLNFDPFVASPFPGIAALFLTLLSAISLYNISFPVLSFCAFLLYLRTPLGLIISEIFPIFKGLPFHSVCFAFAFFISLSSSYGFESIIKGISRKRIILATGTGFIFMVGGMAWGLLSHIEAFPPSWLTPFNIRFYTPLIISILSAAAFLINMKKKAKGFLIFLITFTELYPISFLVYKSVPSSLLNLSDTYISSIMEKAGYSRISGLEPNLSSAFGLYSTDGYEGLVSDHYILGIKGGFRSRHFKEKREVRLSQMINPYPFARLLGVRFMMVVPPDLPPLIPPQKLETIMKKGITTLYEVKDVLPRVFVAGSSIHVKDWKEATEFIRNGYEPLNGVLVEEKIQCSGGNGFAEIKEYEPEKVVVDVEVKGGCAFLVLTDTWYPGWRVYVDGKEERLLRAYGIVRAVNLGEGRHEVLFAYKPWWLIPGAIMGFSGVLLSLFFIGYGTGKAKWMKKKD